MKKEMIEKIENSLYDMYKKIKILHSLKKECKELAEHSERIRKDIMEANIDIKAERNVGIDYSTLRVQTSGNGDSYMDKEMIKAITHLEEEWKYVRKHKLDKNDKIRCLEKEISPLKTIIDVLEESDRRFIEYIYKGNSSIPYAALQLSMSSTKGYKEKDRILIELIDMMGEKGLEL